MDDNYLTVEEVAQRLRVSKQTIYSWIAEGRLESTKLGRVRRIMASSVERFVAAGKNQPVTEDEKGDG